jgi:hypothetical protein
MSSLLPIIVTWDVDPSPEVPYDLRHRSLGVTLDLCRDLHVRSTFFVTANAEHAQAEDLEQMQSLGHEIGCHGLTHTDEEEYQRMPAKDVHTYIEQATSKLQSAAGVPITVFRSPRLKVGASMIDALAACGYVADSSVCSQRIDLISSNLINYGWLVAPRRPYHPHRANPFKRGDSPLWEIPISAAIIPLISAFLSVLGPSCMKTWLRLLAAESRRTGKPIVYLGHPIEFTSAWIKPFAWSQLSPAYIRTHGLLLRKQLYRLDSVAWLQATRDLFAYMASFPGAEFLPLGEYVARELGDSR